MDAGDGSKLELRGYLDVVRRGKAVILLVALGMTGAAVLASLLQTRAYRATAEVLVQPRTTESVFSANQSPSSSGTVETEIQVLHGDPVHDAVRARLGSVPPVSASRLGETEVMLITADSPQPARAAAVANAYADAYVELRKQEAVGDLTAATNGIKDKIASLDAEITALDNRIAQASAADRAAVEASVRPRYNNLLTQQGLLAQKLDQLQVDTTLKTGGARVVKVAQPPASPFKPKPLRNGVAAGVLGLLLGVGVAFLRENLDDSLRTKDELAQASDLPVLGTIPALDEDEGAALSTPSLGRLNSPGAEAYRSLRTSVQLLGVDRPVRTLQVTSPVAGEGKTSVVAGLAVVLASAGQRVIMLDCDLRRPRLHKVFDVPNDVGFTTALLDQASLRNAVRSIAGDERLFLLPSGPLPANPSEVLASKRTAELLFELQSHFDIVLVDSAPVLPITDATVLATWVEATLLVAKAGTTTRSQVVEALAQLRQVDAPLVGTVLNQVARGSAYQYYYGEDGDALNGHRNGRARRAGMPAARPDPARGAGAG